MPYFISFLPFFLIQFCRKREEEKKRRSSITPTPVTSTPSAQTPVKSTPGTPSLNRGSSTRAFISFFPLNPCRFVLLAHLFISAVGIPNRPVPQATSTPANSVVSPSTLSSSVPFKVASEADINDLEEKMLQEAIRLSLQTHSGTGAAITKK